MILIVTYKHDYTADYLIEKLNKINVMYYRLNCEDILSKRISISIFCTLVANIDGVCKFDAVWFRRVSLPDLDIQLTEDERIYYYEELNAFLSNLWLLIDADKWLSIPADIYRAENKVFQLNKASSIGFSIPKTLISFNYREIVEFFNSCNENMIVKPINSCEVGRFNGECCKIFTTKVEASDLKNLKDSYPLPCIYQENISKDLEIRVTVVGSKVFSASVDSKLDLKSKTDWRKGDGVFKQFDLPSNIEGQCVELVESLNLNFGAIDLILKPDGKYVFIEINPNGQWVWIEEDTGLKISEAIVEFLTSKGSDYYYREGVSELHLTTLNDIYNNEEQRSQMIENKILVIINNLGITLALVSFIMPLLFDHVSKNSSWLISVILLMLFCSLFCILKGIYKAYKTLDVRQFKYHRFNSHSILSDRSNPQDFIKDKIIHLDKFIKKNTNMNNSRANLLIEAQKYFRYGLFLIAPLSLLMAVLLFTS